MNSQSKKEEPIPLEELRRILGYDTSLGRLYWIVKKACRTKVGDIAGYPYGRVTPKWLAQIKSDGKKVYLGYYNTAEEAHKAYKKAAKLYHGEFANYGKETI